MPVDVDAGRLWPVPPAAELRRINSVECVVAASLGGNGAPVSLLGGNGGGDWSLGGSIGASGACLSCCGELVSTPCACPTLSRRLMRGGSGGGVPGCTAPSSDDNLGLCGSGGALLGGLGEPGLCVGLLRAPSGLDRSVPVCLELKHIPSQHDQLQQQ